MRPPCVCLCVVLLASGLQGALAGWWMNQPYDNAQSFNYRVEMGSNVTLECANQTYEENGYNLVFWIRPDLVYMEPGYNESFWTIDGPSGWAVNTSSYDLHVYTLQENQLGFYHCVLQHDTTGEFMITKRAINYKKPYYGELWPKYRMNTIIGCSAAGGFLVLCIILLLVCKFKVSPDYDDYGDGSDTTSRSSADKFDPLEGSSGGSSRSSLSDIKKTNYALEGYDNEAMAIDVSPVEGLRYREMAAPDGAEDNTTF